MKKIGLFFGSFNPVHIGHMIIAGYLVENTDLDKVWFVVSPHNPHKERKTLAKDYDRLHLINLAVADDVRLQASSIEFDMPKPSYTVDTLAWLHDKYPERNFALIMGGDNLNTLPKWKNYEVIIENHEIYVYNRPGYEEGELAQWPNIHYVDAPLINLSATLIRQLLKEGKSVRYLVPDPVFEYLDGSNMYR